METKVLTIEDYINQFPAETQNALSIIRKAIRRVVPKAKEEVNYGIPTFKLSSNLVHYAAYKKHIGFYPGTTAILHFENEIKNYKYSKGAVQFPLDKDLPIDLIERITLFCVKEIEKC